MIPKNGVSGRVIFGGVGGWSTCAGCLSVGGEGGKHCNGDSTTEELDDVGDSEREGLSKRSEVGNGEGEERSGSDEEREGCSDVRLDF